MSTSPASLKNPPLPSGFCIDYRTLRGKEAQAFADPAQTRNGGSIDAMLRNCVTGFNDPGPYPFLKPGAAIPWDRILLGDRFEALVRIREASWGTDYEFSTQCEKCKERYEWELALAALPRKLLPDASREVIASGRNDFETEANDGKLVHFALDTGASEKEAFKLRRTQRNVWGLVDACALKIKRIDGLAVAESKKAQRAYLEELPWADITDLAARMEDHDCGIQTDIETICPFCGWQQEIKLPFERDFFLPKRKKSSATTETAATTAETSTSTLPSTNDPSDAKPSDTLSGSASQPSASSASSST